MPRGYNAKEVPNITWEYWAIVELMLDDPSLYHMDTKRSECHKRLCNYYGLSKENSRQITDHLNNIPDAVMLHHELKKLTKDKHNE